VSVVEGPIECLVRCQTHSDSTHRVGWSLVTSTDTPRVTVWAGQWSLVTLLMSFCGLVTGDLY